MFLSRGGVGLPRTRTQRKFAERETWEQVVKLPTFLGLGAGRCATTWLHYALQAHPQISMTSPKEVTFFGKECRKMTLADYARTFHPTPEKPDAPVRGDISPRYAVLSRPCIAFAHEVLPDARLVLIIRNPIQRAWSHAILQLGFIEKRSLGQIPIGAVLRHLERERNVHASDYLRTIEDWTGVFGAEALHVALYDQLCSKPAEFLRDIVRHVGADAGWSMPSQQLHLRYWSMFDVTGGQVSSELDMPEFVRWYLAVRWRDKVRELNERLEGRVSAWMRQIDDIAGRKAPMTWALQRLLNRSVLAWPERAAFGIYTGMREWRLEQSHARLRRELNGNESELGSRVTIGAKPVAAVS